MGLLNEGRYFATARRPLQFVSSNHHFPCPVVDSTLAVISFGAGWQLPRPSSPHPAPPLRSFTTTTTATTATAATTTRAASRSHARRRAPVSAGARYGRRLAATNAPAPPLVPASDHWGNWTFLLSAAALGLWSEKRRASAGKKALAGALVSVLLGLAASSAGVVAPDAPAYRAALDYLLPLAVPLLLFRTDLRRARRSTDAPLRVFLLGSAATAIGTVVAFRLVPMRSLGPDNDWKIAAALMSRHIGGAFSYAAVCEGLGVSPSVTAAGAAAGNTIRALYLAILFALAAKIPAEDSRSTGESSDSEPLSAGSMLPAAQSAMAVAAAFAICRAGKLATSMLGEFGYPWASLPGITALVVVALGTVFPSQIRKLAPSDDVMSVIVIQVFFAVVGANGSIGNAINTAPSILAFAFVQVAVHLLVTLGVGKLLGFDRKILLMASAANVGGLTAACGVAAAKGWTSLLAPAILASTNGIAIITSIGIVLGVLFYHFFFRHIANIIVIAGGTVIGLGGVALTLVGIGVRALAVKFME